LLGRPIGDIDIATPATPDQVMAAAEAAGLKAVATGIDHGTVTLVARGKPHEVTTFRRDVATDGRHAVVAFTTDMAEDAARRDLTLNALYADARGEVFDPLGGLADLVAGRVRFILDPAQRIAEDHLRILRFFRFFAWYGDPDAGLDPQGLAACAAGAEGLDRLSRERVGAEMRKLLAAPDPAPSVAAMARAGILARALPGADPTALGPLVHLEAGLAPDALRRLASLGGQDVAEALRLSRAEGRHLDTLRAAAASDAGLAELAWRHGGDLARDVALLRAASVPAPLPEDMERQIATGAAAVFPLAAADLMPRHQGPALGQALRAAERRWIESGFTLGREDLLR
jgi:poly(A) polymerase